MSKPKTQPVGSGARTRHERSNESSKVAPLSGSKSVKNENHSRNNHGEGH